MLAMVVLAASPALAQQTSGAANAAGATLTAGDLANQCVQVANNVNSGNVDQEAAIDVAQANLGILADIEVAATGGAGGDANVEDSGGGNRGGEGGDADADNDG